MKKTLLLALVALNALLLAGFIGRVVKPTQAVAAPGVRPGDYLMISGEVTGGPAGLVYVVDTTNQMLGAIAYDDTTHRMSAMQKLDLGKIFDQAAMQNNPAHRGAAPYVK